MEDDNTSEKIKKGIAMRLAGRIGPLSASPVSKGKTVHESILPVTRAKENTALLLKLQNLDSNWHATSQIKKSPRTW